MQRRRARIIGLLAVAALAAGCEEPPEETVLTAPAAVIEPVTAAWEFEEARQFDFWIGEWDVNLRVREEDFSWAEQVAARVSIYRILDGKAILELWDSEPIIGFSIRYFDREAGRWVLWLNWPGENRSGGDGLQGEFRHGRGEFFSTFPTEDGGEGISRYTFSDIGLDRLRWDDAFSVDGGNTWSHGWIMEWSRAAPSPEWPIPDGDAHTYHTGGRCDDERFRTFEALAGSWSGAVEVAGESDAPAESSATLTVHRILDGCAVMGFLEYPVAGRIHKEFLFWTFNTYAGKYEQNLLDSREGSLLMLYYGDGSDGVVELKLREGGRKIAWDLSEAGAVRFEESVEEEGGWTVVRSGELLAVSEVDIQE